ncbi:hypothetical protein GCM10009616_21000 [Microlunatus lacustris]
MNRPDMRAQSRTPGPRRRLQRAAATAVALGLAAAAGASAAPAEAVTTTYRALALTSVVSGTSVTVKTTVAASPAVRADYYGVCVRSSSGANLDFPKVATTLSTGGTSSPAATKTFAPGTYSYFPCLYANGAWADVGTKKTFTVGAVAKAPKSTPAPARASTAGRVPKVGKSKLPWNSVVFGHSSKPARFESWRKRPVDGVLYFPARNSWADMGQLPSRRAGDLMIYSIPTFPEGVGGSNAKVAAGTYDTRIRALATKMKKNGWNTNRTVIRLGWENNGNWYQWSQSRGGSKAYKAAFRRFVIQSRAAGLTKVKWDWNLNKGPQAYNAGVSWTTGYPGDDVVDVIGLDAYDMWNPSFTNAQWEANMLRRNPGLEEVAKFARAHKKQMALDEWGVVHDRHGGGDNPFYVAKMFGWLKANADVIAWENTYDHDGAPSKFNHKLSDGGNPKAAAQYRRPYPKGWGG